MERKQALFVASFAGVIASCLIYVFPAFSPTRVFWYYPLEHRWAFELKPHALAMDWYGRTLLAVVASAIAFAGTFILSRRLKPLASRGFNLWVGWAASALLIALSLYAYQLIGRNPVPEPLPTSYVPK